MSRGVWIATAAFAAAVGTSGCRPLADSDDATVPTRQSVAFEGSVDPRFAGTWKSRNGYSVLELDKDGALKSETISFSQKGRSDTKVAGEWRIKGSDLLLRYAGPGGGATVIKYTASLAGNKLGLAIAGGRIKVAYTRK